MSGGKRAVWVLLAGLLLGAACSWPLPRYFASGIASSAQNVEKDHVRRMIPGDHLQFLYHMWLAQDTFVGRTPLFHNLYEFNVGDDAERREVRPYYLPFSLFFAAGSLLGGQAFGWNLAILITLWISGWFSWKLARRYAADDAVAGMLALAALAFPFQWITWLSGSPTGFGMMWVPILLYGIDRWIVDRRASGAALAGAAAFFSEWSDTHVFFFSVLLAPAWIIFCYLHCAGWRRPSKDELRGWVRSSWVLLLFVALAGVKALGVRQGLQDTAIAGGRSLHEIDLFSHGLAGLLDAGRAGGKIYVGIWGLALLAAAFLAGLARAVRRRREAAGWLLMALVLGIVGVFVLSTGTRNPLGPRAWAAWMKLIPPYGMIRQPDKIFCLLPALMLVAGALAFGKAGTGKRKGTARAVCAVLLLPLLVDYAARLDPTICLLDDRQGAYEAVAERARTEGRDPRALALPLWPGDSHYSSLYQHYASLYRIRMVNGYRPTARKKYVEEIFEPFQSLNSGWPTDAQLDALLARGVDHLILHEDAFPEKVSSFPVDATLANLLAHPRLERLARDGPVWSFAIRKTAVPGSEKQMPDVPVLFPVRYWDWEQSDGPAGAVVEAPDAIGGRFARASAPAAAESRWIRTAGPVPMEWHVRLRGTGSFELEMQAEPGGTFRESRTVSADDWIWERIPVPGLAPAAEQTARLRVAEGTLDLDALLLTRAGWIPPAPGETKTIPAVCFFRAGHTRDDFSGVAFRRDRDPNAVIFYSRHLYLEPGAYRIRAAIETDAAPGTELGALTMRPGPDGAGEQRVPVRSGEEAVLDHVQPDSRFFQFGFDYSRTADLAIRSVRIERLP